MRRKNTVGRLVKDYQQNGNGRRQQRQGQPQHITGERVKEWLMIMRVIIKILVIKPILLDRRSRMSMDSMTWQGMSGSGHLLIMMTAVSIKLFGVGRGAMLRAVSAHLTVAAVGRTLATSISDSVVFSKKVTLCSFIL